MSPSDPYLRALDETALALLDRHDSTILLETILTHATALLGTPHGYIYLVEPDEASLVLSHGNGMFVDFVGHRMPVSEGLGGQVFRTGAPVRGPGLRPLRRPLGRDARRTVRVRDGRAAGRRRQDRRRHRPGLGHDRSLVRPARDARAGAVRAAGLDRPRQLAPVRRGPARRPARPDDRPAEPRAPDRPDRPCPRLIGDRGRGAGRGDPPRPRSLQGHQRERRARRRRSAPRRRRPAAPGLPAAERHGRAVRRRRVRDHPRPGRRRGRRAPHRRADRPRAAQPVPDGRPRVVHQCVARDRPRPSGSRDTR